MSEILRLRPYQEDGLAAILASISKGKTRPAVELATGLGKSFMFAHLLKRFVDENPGRVGLVLVHTDELASQAYEEIKQVAPHLRVGIEKAALRHALTDDIVVASVQTLRNPARFIDRVGLIICDEAHHATAATYTDILARYGAFRPNSDMFPGRNWPFNPAAVGFTATLARNDGAPLGEIWQECVFTRSTAWAVRKGYLANPRGQRVVVPDLDLSAVAGRADFRDNSLGEALTGSLAPELIASAWYEHAAGKRTILFAPTVASAEVFAQAFRNGGIGAEVIHGGMPLEDRRLVLKRHRAGDFPVLANCMILTEGYNDPGIQCVIMARPTKSKGLYIQCVGRGLRIDPTLPAAGQECLVLDVAGNHHDLCSLANLSSKPVKDPKSGQTLLDLEDEFDAGVGVEADAPEYYTGPVEVTEFDLLSARSARNWMQTRLGAYFMKGGTDTYVFLAPHDDGTWQVGWVSTRRDITRFACCEFSGRCTCGKRETARGGWTLDSLPDLTMAMAWGEDLAVDLGANPHETYAKKDAPWRKKKPSDKLLALASSCQVKVSEKDRSGVVSDRIAKVLASRRIDPIMTKWKAGQGVS